MLLRLKVWFALVGWLVSSAAFAGFPSDRQGRPDQQTPQTTPLCLSGRQSLPVDNDQVLSWKKTTANQFLGRAHVEGTLIEVYPDRNGHDHFKIQIGPARTDTLEIIYNQEFGALPSMHPGMRIEACGDYITSIAQSGAYPPSPDGAILHWVHKNPRGNGHDSGYVVVDGTLYGWSFGQANPGQRRFMSQLFVDGLSDEAFAFAP